MYLAQRRLGREAVLSSEENLRSQKSHYYGLYAWHPFKRGKNDIEYIERLKEKEIERETYREREGKRPLCLGAPP